MDQNGRTLKQGDVVQLAPVADKVFGGYLFVVAEPKSWGMQGKTEVGSTHYRKGKGGTW